MAAPPDRVCLQKSEYGDSGGDAADESDWGVEPLQPNEDAPSVQGVYFQPPKPSTSEDELVYLSRNSSGDICFKDENNLEVSLTDLIAGAGTPTMCYDSAFLLGTKKALVLPSLEIEVTGSLEVSITGNVEVL